MVFRLTRDSLKSVIRGMEMRKEYLPSGKKYNLWGKISGSRQRKTLKNRRKLMTFLVFIKFYVRFLRKVFSPFKIFSDEKTGISDLKVRIFRRKVFSFFC